MTASLNDIRFRSSPFITLMTLDELTPEQREPLRELENDPDFYRLLIPKLPLSMNLKSVSRQTAELIESLALPSHLDEALFADVVDLVLDGIVEIERDGEFVSGADALQLLTRLERRAFSLSRTEREPDGLTARRSRESCDLSRDALLHAQDLETNDIPTLTAALYLFNRIPKTPFWTERFASREAILAHVGADRGALRAVLERDWTASDTLKGWLSWSSRKPQRGRDDAVTYKLYVSPRPERIRDAFAVVVRVLSAFEAAPFKIGGSVTGLLRSDKMVAYFSTRAEVDEVADVLRRELAGCDGHGVPFTAPLDDTGLLAWGVDPPDNERALQWLGRESWRHWLVQRLAAAISIAKTARGQNAIEPWRFAIERARRHGVDVDTWTPSASLWSAS
ncbi:MAG TPA: hypothetical protein VEK79_19205 [Thermoanaerobaculia bacterium]|nr:hypothetical protein [Thermoanaerobaculia bacterium]